MPHKHFKIKNQKQNVFNSEKSQKGEKGFIVLSIMNVGARLLNFLSYVMVLILILIGVAFLLILPVITDLYKVYSYGIQGKNDFQQGLEQVRNSEYDLAENSFRQSHYDFVEAENIFDELYLRKIPIFKNYGFVVDRFLNIAQEMSLGAVEMDAYVANIYNEYSAYQDVAFNDIPLQSRVKILDQIVQSPEVLRFLKKRLNLSLLYLEQIQSKKVLSFWDNYLEKLKNKLTQAQKIIDLSISLARILPQLTAYPEERTYLVLLQNNHELRPTGGFIGTYGILKIQNAELLDFYTKDVYALDNEAGYYGFDVDPPWQLEEYLKVGQMYLRDANWKPDFEKAAEDVIWFYKNEYARIHGNQPDIDGVIAITPDVIINLITYFGGVEVEGVVYTSENFMELLQYKVEVDWHQQGLSVEERKDVIGEIGQVLKSKIFALSLEELQSMAVLLLDMLKSKDVLLYDSDDMVMDIYQKNDWTGVLHKNKKDDFFMAVDANLASFKTDEVVDRRLTYSLEEKDSSLVATANMAYNHFGEATWKHSDLQSYTRFYVPIGSEFLNASDNVGLEKKEEFSRLSFGTYIKVPIGKKYNLQMQYRLPNYLYENYKNGKYCLYIQKQPGTNHELVISLPILNENYKFMTDDKIIDPVLVEDKYIIYEQLNKDFYGCLVKEE